MSCLADASIVGFVQGRLSDSSAEAVRAHLHDCSACRSLVGRVEDFDDNKETPPRSGSDSASSGPQWQKGALLPGPSDQSSVADPLLGMHVGNYLIQERIGKGGMSVVYLAEHALIGRKVAIKLLRPELSQNQQVVSRFFNEACFMANIHHPGIVNVYDFGYHTDGRAYIVMEYVDGVSLEVRLKQSGPMKVELVLDLARQITAVLAVAHANHVVHRDLKPANVLLLVERELASGLRVKVLDFGVAKLLSESMIDTGDTESGMLIGTPRYMSPEQCLRPHEVDERTDIYSLGCMLYEMLCGRPPFVRSGAGEMIRAHVGETPKSLSSLAQGIPASLDRLILRMLAKQLEARPQSAQELGGLLERVGDSTGGVTALGALADPKMRRPLLAGAGLLLGAVIVAGLLTRERPAASPRVEPRPSIPAKVETIQTAVAPPPLGGPPSMERAPNVARVAAPIEPPPMPDVPSLALPEPPEPVSPAEPERPRRVEPRLETERRRTTKRTRAQAHKRTRTEPSDDGVFEED